MKLFSSDAILVESLGSSTRRVLACVSARILSLPAQEHALQVPLYKHVGLVKRPDTHIKEGPASRGITKGIVVGGVINYEGGTLVIGEVSQTNGSISLEELEFPPEIHYWG